MDLAVAIISYALGAISVIVVWPILHVIAKDGTEVSVLGLIKYTKRDRKPRKRPALIRSLSELSPDAQTVITYFGAEDQTVIQESQIFACVDLSRVRSSSAIAELVAAECAENIAGYVHLTAAGMAMVGTFQGQCRPTGTPPPPTH